MLSKPCETLLPFLTARYYELYTIPKDLFQCECILRPAFISFNKIFFYYIFLYYTVISIYVILHKTTVSVPGWFLRPLYFCVIVYTSGICDKYNILVTSLFLYSSLFYHIIIHTFLLLWKWYYFIRSCYLLCHNTFITYIIKYIYM